MTMTETVKELYKLIAELRDERDEARRERDAARVVLAELNDAAAQNDKSLRAVIIELLEEVGRLNEVEAELRIGTPWKPADDERRAFAEQVDADDEPTCPSCDGVTLNDGYLCDDCAEDACPGCGAMPEEPHDRCCHA